MDLIIFITYLFLPFSYLLDNSIFYGLDSDEIKCDGGSVMKLLRLMVMLAGDVMEEL
jgi:ABC-type multidrug transport system permease subunit